MLSFDDSKARPIDNAMIADDGTVLAVNGKSHHMTQFRHIHGIYPSLTLYLDHVYMVCEPPGEPYYIGRIMVFLHAKSDPTQPVDALRINWFYRPKDIGKKVQDTRMLFATMHSDVSPLTALRGKCIVKHRAEITSMDAYRKNPDSFWFDKMYDRYIQKHYEVIPTCQIVNVPERVKKMLDKHWKYILYEQGRGKELTSAVKSCKRCSGYCARYVPADGAPVTDSHIALVCFGKAHV